ncbi:MAG: hypothetical protein ACM34I_06520 [bacterium]
MRIKAENKFLYIILLCPFLLSCDSAHTARVRIEPNSFISDVRMSVEATEENIVNVFKHFALEIGLSCRPILEEPASTTLFECGPAWHRHIKLYKADNYYVVELFEMHPSPPNKSEYFCRVQDRMFDYFQHQFGKDNIKIETTDPCGKEIHQQ